MFDFFQQENLQVLLETAGIYAPLLFILLQAAQVIIAPIPMQVFGFAGGYVFGAFWGTVYSLIGLVVGSLVVLWLARKFGRPLVDRFVKKETQEKFDSITRANGLMVLFIIFLFPGLPDDAICFLAGLSTLRIRDVLVVSALGRLPGIAGMSIIGAQVADGGDITLAIIIISAVVVIVGVGYLYKDKVVSVFMNRDEQSNDQ